MTEGVQIAIITALSVVIPSIITNVITNNKTNALINFRLDILEKKQDKYNNLQERTFELEKKARLYEEKMEVANHRIKDLEDIERGS